MNKNKLISLLKNISALLVVAALLVIVYYQNRDRDVFKFGKDESSKIVSDEGENIRNDMYLKSDVRRIGDKIVYVTPSTFSVLNKKAEGTKIDLTYSEPYLHSSGDYSVVFDKDSMNAEVYKNDRKAYSVALENKIVKAKINSNGYLLVATEKEGYNCECLVFNRNGEAIFKWDISESEYLDGVINHSNNAIIISTAAADNDKLCGEISLINIKDAKVIQKHVYESELFFEVEIYKNDNAVAFGNNSLIGFNSDGTQKWDYTYKDKKILKADISEADMLVLAFSSENGIMHTSATDVKIFNRLGKVVAEKTFDAKIDALSVTDSAVSMAYGKKVIITDGRLKEKETVVSDSNIEKMALFADNKHVFVISSSESKILE